jgi:hypothetical protein
MSVRIVSYEAQVKAAIQAQLAGNLDDAAKYYAERLRARISIQGPPRSTPGNSPHKDSGDLHDSIEAQPVDVANLTVRVSSDMFYAADLELGVHVAARPYWIPTLIAEADEIARLICK